MKSNPTKKQYPDIGTVTYNVSIRSKRISIKVKADGSVVVAMPVYTDISTAEKFLLSKSEWIKAAMRRVSKRKQAPKLYTASQENITKFHHLEIGTHASADEVKIFIKNGAVSVFYPQMLNVEDARVQNSIKKGITLALKKESVKYLKPRIEQFAKKFLLPIGEVSFRDNKSRWGSCSGNNNITLNIQLMRLPDELIDYVILHELAHIKHKNHSPAFRKYLDTLLGQNSRALEAKIRNYSPYL
ncbi:MAG: M48 family metallopeptidase [Bacteroidales bacterium]|nr:M48 family metallopeptidase [Bacteroidales bacterium]